MKNIIIALIISLFFTSCEKSDPVLADATPELLLAASYVKKWELIDPAVKIVVGTKLPVIKSTAPAGQVSNGLGHFYFIFLDKTIQFQDGYGTTANDKAVVKGTWDFTDASKKAINVTLGSETKTWQLTTLTPSRLVITVEGVSQTYAPTTGNP